MPTPAQSPTPRQQVAKLLSDYSCKKLTGDEFVNAVVDVCHKKDENLDLVVEWLFETFEPEFGKPDFDIDNPLFRIRRRVSRDAKLPYAIECGSKRSGARFGAAASKRASRRAGTRRLASASRLTGFALDSSR